MMTERSGIEIDYCPKCRGVWLDRGELDKIIERASADAGPAAAPRREARPEPESRPGGDYRHGRDFGRGHDRDRDDDDRHRHRGRRKSILDDLFDF
jgi:Zn-finger nucleic acid-binding protein